MVRSLLFAVAIAFTLEVHADAPTLAHLGFLAGSWSVTTGGAEADLQFGDAAGGMILGTFKLSVPAQVFYAEEPEIVMANGVPTLYPHPINALSSGSAGAAYPLKSYANNVVVFENLQVDFPKTITYQLLNPTTLIYQVEGVKKGFPPLERYTMTKN